MTCERKKDGSRVFEPNLFTGELCGGELEEKGPLVTSVVKESLMEPTVVTNAKIYQCASCRDVVIK